MKALVCVAVFVAVSAAFGSPYTGWMSEETVTPGTLGLWSYNAETLSGQTYAKDLVGNSWYRADWINSPASFVTNGKFGGGLSVPQSSNSNVSNIEGGWSLWPSEQDPSVSIQAWVNVDEFNTYDHYIVDKKGTMAYAGGFMLRLYHEPEWAANQTKVTWVVGSATVGIDAFAQTDLVTWQPGQWYHVAGTWNAADDTARIYLNGQLVASATVPGLVMSNIATQDLRPGSRITSSYSTINGRLDDVKYSSVAYEYAVPEPATMCLLGLGAVALLKRKIA